MALAQIVEQLNQANQARKTYHQLGRRYLEELQYINNVQHCYFHYIQ